MAASVLHSAESAVPSFTVGHPARATGIHGLSNAPGPGSWNRSLDRALDEAAATGVLNLSGRKLKEFPVIVNFLSKTTHYYLSRNRLPELPVEVCMFVSLENLNLYQNCLRSLPESLINLQSLTYLNISRNQLSTLPAHLCRLPLKVLIACNNKLVSLPEDLGKLRHLTELDVSCNEIQTLPPQIGQLETLRDLNIRRNHLVRLPPEVAELPLVRLDFSCNKVTSIPVCYRNLRQLQSIILDNNPLQSPPAQICIKGKIHIFKYLNMEALVKRKRKNRLLNTPELSCNCLSSVERERKKERDKKKDRGVAEDLGDKRWSGNEASGFQPVEGRSQLASAPILNYACLLITQLMSLCVLTLSSGESRCTHTHSVRESRVQCFYSCRCGCVCKRVAGVTSGSEKQISAERRCYELRQADYLLTSQTFTMGRWHRTHDVCMVFQLCVCEHNKSSPSPTKLSPTDTCYLKSHVSCSISESVPLQTVHSHRRLRPLYGKSQSNRNFIVKRTQSLRLKHTYTGEEADLIEQLRRNIECRLKVSLPSDLGAALTDGVVLCHLANHVRPRSIPSIHVPSPAVPKLTMAKCRRNVENFLEACRRIGVPQKQLCLPLHVLEERGLSQVAGTVQALLDMAPPKQTSSFTL
ncbi:Leucine-rich repeat and calponin -like proteiny domain-containing protein 3 [Triplophysa tibetana]|uniref:Leucine-rich repeat and calponin-like proteiny domain-containing protein 3 n=1 Tax=Triplophysa tibetana TaxID=1572043 RepID=A0A5A9P3B1_9TELE|nr:Leucine-rich repeat and calponin -like proteiny domain-containing protein 3 [Triplophysa tibetana]